MPFRTVRAAVRQPIRIRVGLSIFHKIGAHNILEVDVVGAESIESFFFTFNSYAHLLQKADEIPDITYLGHILNRDFLRGQQS